LRFDIISKIQPCPGALAQVYICHRFDFPSLLSRFVSAWRLKDLADIWALRQQRPTECWWGGAAAPPIK
jgi:hypothetical protein